MQSAVAIWQQVVLPLALLLFGSASRICFAVYRQIQSKYFGCTRHAALTQGSYLEVGRRFYEFYNALPAICKGFGSELGQNDSQDGVVVAGHEMLIHTLTYTMQQKGS